MQSLKLPSQVTEVLLQSPPVALSYLEDNCDPCDPTKLASVTSLTLSSHACPLTHSALATPASLLPLQHLGGLLPQGLCSGCSLCPKHSSLRASHSWRFLILQVSAQLSPPLRSPSSLPHERNPLSQVSIITPHFLSFRVICQHLKSSFLLITCFLFVFLLTE